MSDSLLNFAYGSNMSSDYLRQYCPGAEAVMRAVLPNMRVEFRRFSTDLQGGTSTIMPAPGDAVHGVVYKLSQPDLAALDALEDLDEGIYIRETHLVLGEDREWHQAELYRVATPEGPFEPSSRYVGWMLDGAHEHGLPAEYISKIEDLAR